MDVVALWRDYGWLGILLLWLLPRVWQFLTERFFPHKVARVKREEDRRDEALQAEREARTILLKSQIDREERELLHRQEIDRRVAQAIENMGTVIQQMGLAITVGNERITQLISAHSRHDNDMISAHDDIGTRIEQLQQQIETKKEIEEIRAELHDTQRNMKINRQKKDGE